MAVTVTHATPADGTFSAPGSAAWDEAHTVAGVGTMATETATDYLAKSGNLSGLANTGTSRTNLGVAIGTNVQAYSANLDEYAGVNPTAAGLALLDDADADAQIVTLSAVKNTSTNGNVSFKSAALATTATTGYVMLPSCAGVPTGVPASIPTGQIALIFDSVGADLYAYIGGAWVPSSPGVDTANSPAANEFARFTDADTIEGRTTAELLSDIGITSSVAELNYTDGVTSAIQTQINTKSPTASPTFTGTVTIPTPFTLGAVSVLPTGTELNFVDGVTSAIQTQLDAKSPLASPTFTGTVTLPTPFTLGAVSVMPTGTELNYVDGVTSAIQTQLNAKAPIASPVFVEPVTIGDGTTQTDLLLRSSTGNGAFLGSYLDIAVFSVNRKVSTGVFQNTGMAASNITLLSAASDSAITLSTTATNNVNPTVRVTIDKNGLATFANDVVVPDEAYGVGWNGSLEVPTKNAVYDKIETLGGGGTVDTANSPAATEFARFTDADTIEGRTVAETKADLGLGTVATFAVDNVRSNGVCNGRLTTETGVPISAAERTAQGTLYFTPFQGNQIGLYSGSAWAVYTFTEKSLALTLTSGKNKDVFIYDNAGTLTLELSADWTNDTTRADALVLQDGVYVKSGATTRRWLGTIRASGTNTIEDSLLKRFVWNAYNHVKRRLYKIDGVNNTWTYGGAPSGTVRYANADAANRVEVVIGDNAYVQIILYGMGSSNAAGYFSASIGEDSNTAYSADAINYQAGGIANYLTPLAASLGKRPAIGFHYYSWLELGDGTNTTTFFSYNAGVRQAGLSGFVMG